jgi:lysophospholipase L1-like esterase
MIRPTLHAIFAVFAGVSSLGAWQGAARPAQAAAQSGAPFESEIAAFEAADRKNPPPKGAVLFVGSSSIRLWRTLAYDFPEIKVINRGFGGSQLADSVRYAPRIVIPYRPRMVVLYAGTNDISSGKTPQQVFDDFRKFVAVIHAALPTTRIVFISINPAVSRWSKEPQFLEANRLIALYLRESDGKVAPLSYIDTHAGLLSPSGQPRPEILRSDGLHLNSRGYALWRMLLRPRILALAGRERVRGGGTAHTSGADR